MLFGVCVALGVTWFTLVVGFVIFAVGGPMGLVSVTQPVVAWLIAVVPATLLGWGLWRYRPWAHATTCTVTVGLVMLIMRTAAGMNEFYRVPGEQRIVGFFQFPLVWLWLPPVFWLGYFLQPRMIRQFYAQKWIA